MRILENINSGQADLQKLHTSSEYAPSALTMLAVMLPWKQFTKLKNGSFTHIKNTCFYSFSSRCQVVEINTSYNLQKPMQQTQT